MEKYYEYSRKKKNCLCINLRNYKKEKLLMVPLSTIQFVSSLLTFIFLIRLYGIDKK